ncbi:MAG TPA: DinB family protein [Mycolicibacterium fallax]|nr:DinB family protein [Mycolicibacterium fallax]HSA39657.1 DinB family protein [Mycobacterium sp.]
MIQPGVAEYGEPCRECGFGWRQPYEQVLAEHDRIHHGYADAVTAQSYRARIDALAWSVGEYVCHVADNEHIWVERFAALPKMAEPRVAPYDQNALAAARHYPEIPYEAAMGSVRRAHGDFTHAVNALPAAMEFHHPEAGTLTVLGALRVAVHECHHHLWDIRRILAG